LSDVRRRFLSEFGLGRAVFLRSIRKFSKVAWSARPIDSTVVRACERMGDGMNRFHSALLASLLVAGQAWGQRPLAGSLQPPTPRKPPPEKIVADPTMPDEWPPPPTPLTPTPVPEPIEGDSVECVDGCCNLGHPWRRSPSITGGDAFNTCSLCDDAICGLPGRIWGGVDFLYWRVRGDALPALVTTSPSDPLTPVAEAGVLPKATVLVGQSDFNSDPRFGVRLNLGAWINTRQTFGVQFSGFWLEDRGASADFASDGSTILARPFTNLQANPAVEASQLVAYPDVVSGNINVGERNTFQGFDFAFRGNVCCGNWWRVDALFGYRHLRFTEQLLIQQRLVAGVNAPTALGIPTGTIVTEFDRFDTGNEYHAAQAGFTAEMFPWEKLSFSATGKLAFGVVNQGVGVDGATTFSTDNVTRVGGLLALNSNIGTYRRSDSSLVPELLLTAGYQVTDNIRVRLGYDLIYFPNVQRAGSVIDLGIDPRRIPPVTNPTVDRPTFDNLATDLFIQGVHASLEFRY
jgi:hypothetical protein